VIAHHPGDNLAGAPTQGSPQPAFIPALRPYRPMYNCFEPQTSTNGY
jgi:hypothetical protein